jgi:UDP-glucose 4-epimerase
MLLGEEAKRVFVSGGAGFIGSHVLDLLVPQGYDVTVYDNLSNGRRAFIEHLLEHPNVTFIEACMLDLDRVTEAMQGHHGHHRIPRKT